MKFKGSKKFISLFLSLLMIVSSVPAFAINASAAENTKYLFAYFTGNATSEQKIHFATSTDGKSFTALNGGNQTVTQKTGTQCARDPYLFYSEKENCYYLLATDYDYSHNNWGDKQSTMTVWKSNDLITWSNETHIDAKNIPGGSFENNLWAPQALWDDAEQKYMVYYSTDVKGSKAVVYSYTSDLFDVTKYSVPQMIGDFAFSNIDADITKVGDEYVLFIKNEDGNSKKIYAAVSSTPNSFSNPVLLNSKNKSFEGPQLYKTSTGYTLAFDEFGNSGNVWLHEFTNDQFASFVANVKTNPSSIDISSYYSKTVNQSTDGFAARHGSIISITDEQYNALQNAKFNQSITSNEGVPDFASDSDYLVARYLVNDVTNDTTKKNGTLTNNNGVSWDSSEYDSLGAAQFSMNNNSYLSLNTSMLNGTTANGFTVSLLGKPSSSNTTPNINNMQGRFFEFTTASYREINYDTNRDNFTYLSEAHNGIVQVSDKNYDKHIAADTGSSNNYYNDWHLYTVSVSSSGITVYIDGVKSASTGHTSEVTYEGFINNLASCNLLIGASGWPDNTYDGYIRDLRVYNKAITDAEASKLPKQYQLDSISSKMDYANSVLNANTANSTSAESFNGDAYYTGNNNTYTAPESSRQNILYGSKTTNFSSGDNDVDYTAKKAALPNSTVLVYDGVNTPAYPIYLEAWPTGENNIVLTGATYTGSAPFKFNSNWSGYHYGNWSTNIFEITTNKVLQNSNDNQGSKGNVASTEFNFGTKTGFPTNNGHYWWTNTLYYTGSGNTDSYYEKHSNNVSITVSHRNYTWPSWKDRDKAVSANNEIYVINYKPVYDILSNKSTTTVSSIGKSYTFKDLFNEVYNNQWQYTEESLASYLYAVAKLTQLNLNDSFKNASDNQISSKVSTAASQIKDYSVAYNAAVSNLKLKTFKIKFVKADGTEVDKTVTAGKSLSGLIPDVTAIKNNKNGTHDVYYWPSDCTESVIPDNDLIFYEEATTHDCNYKVVSTVGGVTTKECSDCGYKFTLDVTAYNAAVAEAQAAIENTAKYTETSRNELQSVLNNNKLENAKSQPELNAMTKAIIEATNALKLNTYTVKFYKVINNGDPELVNEYSGEYGKDVTLESGLDDSYAITKWTKTVGEADEKVGSSNTTLLTRYYANVNYYVYASKAESKGDNSAIVALTDRTGRVVDNRYVDLVDGKATVTVKADVANKTVTVDGTPLKAVDLTFYTITGFKIGDTVLKDGEETQVDITKDLTISTVYGNSKSFNIKSSDGSCHPSVSEAFWDQKVTVTADKTTANTKWLVNGVVVAYGTNYVFRATKDVDIKCVTDSSSVAKATATIENLSYHSPTANTITVVGSFNLPEGCTLVSQGALLKTTSSDTTNSKAAVDNIDNYTGANANARKFIAYNYSKDANQYMITFYASKYYPSLYIGAVAFVTYKDADGVEHTEYSDLVTYTHGNA